MTPLIPLVDLDGRGQTPIDFAVGASVFLLTLAFVIAFVPTLFEPFTAAETATPVVGDRVAAGVAGDLLAASPTEPSVLSPACTVAFFDPNASLAGDADCPDGVTDDLDAHFGVDDDLQVVVHPLDKRDPVGNASTVSVDTEHGRFDVELDRYTSDPTATAGDDVTVSQRLVSIDGDQYRLTVRVW
ncbi:hypothetical protein GJ633_06270 [Halorubrum sp. CBA1125]|uniref:DUF7287 family protein n=1 Tax=Halorubrum sp. CBA1125 TaxID=2668072 RepID=UPI0012E81208|nr:hypothetical protein [Halorubrum sp. CBA1125]MUW14307.1 hypothetical protein [Halorubrum sp. CBA1125]